ncbi:MAG: OmpA family protein, partial [Cyclobacteriaceae bacterium]|nr:OmpA family protein [Cyclobacteriaceae bacterium]
MLVLFVVFAGVKVSGQNIQWADTVYSFSSERKISNHVSKLHPNAYKARMILGKPNVMPGNEGTSRVWTPQKSNSVEYIKVGFAQPMKVKQIAIAEVFNPTAIDKVYLYDVDGGEIEIDILRPRSLDLPGRLLNIFIDETPKEILAVKIVLDGNLIPGFSGIDAVAISDSYKPISVNTTISDGLHTSVDPEKLDDNINSPFKEIKPLLSPDGKTMFFSRINHPENMGGEKDMEDIWLSQRNEETGMWSKATNAGPLLNNEGPNFIAAIAPAGYTYSMLLGNIYRPNGKMT